MLVATQVRAGDKTGNGGDLCESRIKLIRDDLGSWISREGYKNLDIIDLSIDLELYRKKMSYALTSRQSISCVERILAIDGSEKTCVNRKRSDGTSEITCNIRRFNNLSESDQYVLVHHEYAGLAGIEVNGKDGSVYPLSNQISEFLADVSVKKLAIKKSKQDPDPAVALLRNAFRAGSAPNLTAAQTRLMCDSIRFELNPPSDDRFQNDLFIDKRGPIFQILAAFVGLNDDGFLSSSDLRTSGRTSSMQLFIRQDPSDRNQMYGEVVYPHLSSGDEAILMKNSSTVMRSVSDPSRYLAGMLNCSLR